MTAKRTAVVVAVVLLLAAVAWRVWPRSGAPEPVAAVPPTVVGVAKVVRGPIAETTTLSGTLQAASRVEITSQLPSRVTAVPVREGMPVRAGQLLVQLDARDIESGVARAAAGVEARRAQLDKAGLGKALSARVAESRVARARGGREAAAANARQARLGVGLARSQADADLATARAGLAAAQANLAQAQHAAALEQQQADADVAAAEAGYRAAGADVDRATHGAEAGSEAAHADVDRARAGVSAAEAGLARAKAGARPEDIDAAEAQVEQARIGRDRAQKEVDDLRFLHDHGGVAGADLEGARTQLGICEQQLRAAQAQLRKARAGATAEELAAAQAQVDEARAGLRAAEAGLKREQVSAAEVAGAQAQQARAAGGLEAAKKARAGRRALAGERVKAARGAVDQAAAGVAAAEAGRGRTAVRQAEQAAADATVASAAAGVTEAELGRGEQATLAADIRAAAAGVAEAAAQHREAVAALDRARIVSPVDGVVAQLTAHVGDSVLPGLPLVVIETTRAAELTALATAEQRARLLPGQRAAVRVTDGAPPLEGWVREVAKVAEADGRTFKVFIVVRGDGLQPGLYGTADVTVASDPRALLVPVSALQEAAAGAPFVFVVAGGKAVRSPVTLGLRGERSAQVVVGLTEGQEVVSEGAGGLFDGAAVEARPASAAGGGS